MISWTSTLFSLFQWQFNICRNSLQFIEEFSMVLQDSESQTDTAVPSHYRCSACLIRDQPSIFRCKSITRTWNATWVTTQFREFLNKQQPLPPLLIAERQRHIELHTYYLSVTHHAAIRRSNRNIIIVLFQRKVKKERNYFIPAEMRFGAFFRK